jgi:hypothetical protein
MDCGEGSERRSGARAETVSAIEFERLGELCVRKDESSSVALLTAVWTLADF